MFNTINNNATKKKLQFSKDSGELAREFLYGSILSPEQNVFPYTNWDLKIFLLEWGH